MIFLQEPPVTGAHKTASIRTPLFVVILGVRCPQAHEIHTAYTKQIQQNAWMKKQDFLYSINNLLKPYRHIHDNCFRTYKIRYS